MIWKLSGAQKARKRSTVAAVPESRSVAGCGRWFESHYPPGSAAVFCVWLHAETLPGTLVSCVGKLLIKDWWLKKSEQKIYFFRGENLFWKNKIWKFSGKVIIANFYQRIFEILKGIFFVRIFFYRQSLVSSFPTHPAIHDFIKNNHLCVVLKLKTMKNTTETWFRLQLESSRSLRFPIIFGSDGLQLGAVALLGGLPGAPNVFRFR